MKFKKLLIVLPALFLIAVIILTSCDNRVVEPLNYTIASITTSADTIYYDGNQTFATISVMVKDEDNFAVLGQVVQFRSNIGNLLPAVATTDSSGIASVDFYEGNDIGLATIEAFVDEVSESIDVMIAELPPEPPVDVNSIGFDVSDQIWISVQGTGGTETAELVVSLYDVNQQLVMQPKTVWFELLYYPEGTNINNVGITDSTLSSNGKASVSINSGTESGIVTVQAWTYNLEGNLISARKSNIIVASGFTENVEFSIGGHNTGDDMGAGYWQVQVAALLTDIEGNPVAYGVAVYFSLPEEPEWATIEPAAYVGNQNAQGDSLAGVAYTFLTYAGSYTNETILVRIVTGIEDIFEGELVLPIQYPVIDIAAVPLHIDWVQGSPYEMDTEIRITVKDGQNNPIDNQVVTFSSTLGEPQEPWPPDTGDPYTGLTGVVDNEHGRLNKIVTFQKHECPPPIPSPPGTTTATITAQILGTQTSNQITVILNRYYD